MLTLPDATLAGLSGDFERLLHAHARRSISLVLSRVQVLRIREVMQLGPVALAALNSIQRRSDDLRSGLLLSRRVVTLHSPDALSVNARINHNGSIDLRLGEFCSGKHDEFTHLFVEHIANDGLAVELIFRLVCHVRKLPTNLVFIRPMHGGGSTLSAVLEALHADARMGLTVADRDCPPFNPALPYKQGGTACAVKGSAVALGLLAANDVGPSSCDPFFGLWLTGARTIEGCIGPALYEVFFNHFPQAGEARQKFLRAFTHLPDLTDQEWKLWRSLDLKRGGLEPEVLGAAIQASGLDGVFVPEKLRRANKCVVPGNAISWIYREGLMGRFKVEVVAAFEKDRLNPAYSEMTDGLWQLVWDFLSADERAVTA